MNTVLILLLFALAWQMLRVRYQRTHILLLGQHLSSLQLERHMETLTEGYTRAIGETDEIRQRQVLEMFTQNEAAVATQSLALANAMQKESLQATSMTTLPFCLPYAEQFLPGITRDFRKLLHIHAAGLRYVVDNQGGWDAKNRAFHLSAELYLLQHSCHWFCKSRAVADARLLMRHQVQHQKVLESVSDVTRLAYQQWLETKT
ncbi:hypothetical protein H0A58_01955 [Alcaligenaceae bacterium]|nr:hypothetical protein [Alcaligenaceae bacterium]